MKYFNRDLSWVEFNARILNEGTRKDNPLLERIKYLGIVSTNFDEFFEVRVASMKRQLSVSDDIDISGEKISVILKKISERSHKITEMLYEELKKDIKEELPKIGINYVSAENFNEKQRAFSKNFFENDIFPLLTPLKADENIHHIQGKEIFIAFEIKLISGVQAEKNLLLSIQNNEKNKNFISFVQIPQSLERIVWVPSENGKSFTFIDDIILEFGTKLFPGFSVESSTIFSIDRDADMGVDEESSEFIEAMENVIASRHNSFAVRLLCSKSSEKNENLISYLKQNLNLKEDDIYRIDGPIHPEDLNVIEDKNENQTAIFPQWKNFNPLKKSDKSIWELFALRDRLLFLPYESFDPVVKLLETASEDQKTLAIKMTLYRTEKNSAIVKALIRAAQNGKQVTVFVELKARFNEEENISWANKLEKAGAIVIFGIVNLKVHGKAMMIIRKENDRIRRYVHLSTGNYNAKTAKIYSDVALFTTNPEIATDITLFFNLISGYSALQTMNKIAVAPVNLKTKLLSMIKREAESSTPENPGMIVAKMNALGHEEIIDALYEASQKGVKILLNVRGICQLVPTVKNQSENIKVVSVVGRYLEHSRIIYFKNSGNEEIYLSSADWMPRNLDKRVELLFPVTDQNCFMELKENLMRYFEQDPHSSLLTNNGEWITNNKSQKMSVQEEMYEKYKEQNEIAKKKKIEFEVRRK